MEQTQIDARAREVRSWYEGHVFKCQMFQQRFEAHLLRTIQRAGLQDARVESRTKAVDSFVQKALKVDLSGGFKYADPRREITDMVGVRVMVPLSTDIFPIAQLVQDRYEVEEEVERGEEEAHVDIPGYRSLHLLVRLKPDAVTDPDLAPFTDMLVEIQVRTILQHAWAMLQHDVMYKAERPPSPVVKRRLVALAGLLELADREFVQVRQAHAEVRDAPSRPVDRPDERLTATSLRHLAETVVGEEDGTAHEWFVCLKEVTDAMGLSTVGELGSVLGPWRERAAEVSTVARRRQPWLNTALLMDLLLRLATGDRYFDARPPTAEDGYEPADVVEAREGFHAELHLLRAELDQA